VKSPDGRTMAIKASGTALTLMSETDGWVEMDVAAVLSVLDRADLAALRVKQHEVLHSMLGRVVVHTHAVASNAWNCGPGVKASAMIEAGQGIKTVIGRGRRRRRWTNIPWRNLLRSPMLSEPSRTKCKGKAGMFRAARKLLAAGLGEKKWIILVLLLLIAGLTMLALPLDAKQPTGPIAPTVSAALPSEGGADRDAVHEALEKCNRRAFDLFLLGGRLIEGTVFLLLGFGLLKRVWRIEFGPHSADPEHTPPTCTTDAANREGCKNAPLKQAQTSVKQSAETSPNTEDARQGYPGAPRDTPGQEGSGAQGKVTSPRGARTPPPTTDRDSVARGARNQWCGSTTASGADWHGPSCGTYPF